MSGTKEKKLNLPQSLLLLLLIIVSVAVCIRLKTGGPMIGLFASWIFIYLPESVKLKESQFFKSLYF